MNSLFVSRGALRPWFLLTLSVLVVATAFLALGMGRFMVHPADILHALVARAQGGTHPDVQINSVVTNMRLPRIIVAVFVGAGLAVAGAAFQSLFSNPLATPDTLGVSAGTCVGAVCALLLGWNMFGVQCLALLAGLATVAITTAIASRGRRTSIIMLILAGVVVSALANAIISLLKLTADPTRQLPEITYWLMGSLSGITFHQFGVAAVPITVGVAVIVALRWRLNVLALSEDEARAVGANLQVLRPVLIIASTMITASVVSICGQVGWIGLLVPHIARMLVGHNNRCIIPVSALLGAVLMLVIDTAARTVSASEIPISVLTAIVGAPIFIVLLRSTGGSWK